MQRPNKQELKKLYNRYKTNWKKYHTGVEYRGMCPACYEEWLETEFKHRFEVFVGFNTKQIWIEDLAFNVLIDPPRSVLESLPDWRDVNSDWEEKLYNILLTDPDWLYDREHWYDKDVEV